MIKVALCDDHEIVRKGLKQILDQASNIKVVADVSSGEELLQQLRKIKQDVIVLDVALPGRSGLEILKQIKSTYPEAPVLILSMYSEEQFAIRMIKAGASGYLHKDSPPKILFEAISTVATGKKYISSTLSELLIKEIEHPGIQDIHKTLSDREYEIMLLLGKGYRVSDIASMLSLSIKTVSTHKTRMFKKLGFHSTSDLIRFIMEKNLIPPSSAPLL